jgi:hypothetical protein
MSDLLTERGFMCPVWQAFMLMAALFVIFKCIRGKR